MKNKVISREKLFSFGQSEDTRTTVFLTIYEDSQPVIETEIGVFRRKIGNSICLSDLFQIVPIDRDISQLSGDGPEFDKLDKEHVNRATQEALSRVVPKLGQLKIVWVPDDGLPF